jgi:hypothetical protein
MRGKRADLSGLVFGNLTVLPTWYRLEVPPIAARARRRGDRVADMDARLDLGRTAAE